MQSKVVDHAAIKSEMRISLQLKALHAKNKKRIGSGAALTTDNGSTLTRMRSGFNNFSFSFNKFETKVGCNSKKFTVSGFLLATEAVLVENVEDYFSSKVLGNKIIQCALLLMCANY